MADLTELRAELREANDAAEHYKGAWEREKARAGRLWALLDMIEVAGDAVRLKEDARLDVSGWLGEVGAEIPF